MSRLRAAQWIGGNFWLLFGFSIFYFADVCLRASEKYFWYDELFTVHLSQFPGFQALWNALSHGADFNPPFFYLLTRASQAIFGHGLVGTRMPEIIGFWIMCVCLFQFVNRRAGPLSGSIAMLLPMLTGAFYYAYEARPYGIVLGCCGLALVFWQRASDAPRRGWWLAGFSFFLFAAFMLHCYALVILVPFALTELFRTIRSRRIDTVMWAAQLAPVIPALLLYIPLLRSYGSLIKGTNFEHGTVPNWPQVTNFYVFLFTPCLLIMILAVILLVVDRLREVRLASVPSPKTIGHTVPELVLAICFTALPVFGVILGKSIHGPFFARYFISAIAGVCVLAGLAVAARKRTSWMAIALVAVIGCAVGLQFTRVLWHRYHGWGEHVVEPVSGMSLDTTPADPLDAHRLLVSESRKKPLPIAVTISWDFLYLLHYAPQLAPRLYYIAQSENDLALRGFRRDRAWLPVPDDRELTSEEFLRAFPDSLVYCDQAGVKTLAALVQAGGKIQSLKIFDRHFLAEVVTKQAKTP